MQGKNSICLCRCIGDCRGFPWVLHGVAVENMQKFIKAIQVCDNWKFSHASHHSIWPTMKLIL